LEAGSSRRDLMVDERTQLSAERSQSPWEHTVGSQ
jgi:hypothetical protein